MGIGILLLIVNLMTTNKLDNVVIVEPDEITAEVLENRVDNYLLVEKVEGTILDSEGNGEINNTEDEYYNYISYHRLTEEGYEEGTRVLTYYIYDNTDGEDTIIERYDFILETPWQIIKNVL